MRRAAFHSSSISRSSAVPRHCSYATRTVGNTNKSEHPNLLAINPQKISINKTVQNCGPVFVNIGSFTINVNRINYIYWNENESQIRFAIEHGIDASKKYYPFEHAAIKRLINELTNK